MQAVNLPYSLAPFAASVFPSSVAAAAVLSALAAGLGFSCLACWQLVTPPLAAVLPQQESGQLAQAQPAQTSAQTCLISTPCILVNTRAR